MINTEGPLEILLKQKHAEFKGTKLEKEVMKMIKDTELEKEDKMECLVAKCKNKDHQGNGIYLNVIDQGYGILGTEWICIPCWKTLKGIDIEKFSQLYRNVMDANRRSEEWKKQSWE